MGEGWGEGWHWQKTLKTAALTLALSFFIAAPAMAQAPVPTLDRLNQEGTTIPDTNPPQVYPESAYTLTEIENADPENLPQNAITLYDKTEVIKYYDPQTGLEIAADDRLPDVQYKEVTTIETTPKYYLVNLKDSVTNIGEGDVTKYFEWSQNAEGNLELKEVSAPTEGKTTITYSYNPDSFTQKVEGLTSNPSVTDPSGTTSSKPYIIEGGVGLNNPADKTTSIDNVLYKDNKVTGTLESTTSGSKYAQVSGGAVYNAGTITAITGAFINNEVASNFDGLNSYGYDNNAFGGALYNTGEIGDIAADFIGNNASTSQSCHGGVYGGAIYNDKGIIGDITGNFVGNYADGKTNGVAYGGAIYNNQGTIENITGNFIGNYINVDGKINGGGAIYNYKGTIKNITGSFIGNYSNNDGGAIYNYGTIGDITGDFIGNYLISAASATNGGAIVNIGIIGDITGDFIGNFVKCSSSSLGGAIYNTYNSTIGNITGDFIGNYTSGNYAYGGAIFNVRTIGNITGDFIGNYASSTNFDAYGGAILNGHYSAYGDLGTDTIPIGNITGNFIGNYASGRNAYGGAIYNDANRRYDCISAIGDITGNFISNYASGSSYAFGGAIYNDGIIEDITGDFIGNYASSTNSSAHGGAIYNLGLNPEIGNITGDFIGNYVSGNSYAFGGAIYNVDATIGSKDDDGNVVGGIINSSFINNHATATAQDGVAKGGAIYTDKSLNIIAKDGGQSVFSGNYVQDKDGKRPEAIYVQNYINAGSLVQETISIDTEKIIYQEKNSNYDTAKFPELTLNTNTNGIISFDDQISGDNSNLVNNTSKFQETILTLLTTPTR